MQRLLTVKREQRVLAAEHAELERRLREMDRVADMLTNGAIGLRTRRNLRAVR